MNNRLLFLSYLAEKSISVQIVFFNLIKKEIVSVNKVRNISFALFDKYFACVDKTVISQWQVLKLL